MIHPGFERISPTPSYPMGVTAAHLNGLRWVSQAAAAKAFRNHVKTEMRRLQRGCCCHCRRPLGLEQDTHIEHFIERAVIDHFDYEIQNLAISCSVCNGAKNRAFLALSKRIRSRNPTRQWSAPALATPLTPGCPLPAASVDYRWIHPHVDGYSVHVAIRKGWIYQPYTAKGRRSIRGLRLNEVFNIERRLRQERLMARQGRLSMLVAAFAELDRATAKQVVSDVLHISRSGVIS